MSRKNKKTDYTNVELISEEKEKDIKASVLKEDPTDEEASEVIKKNRKKDVTPKKRKPAA
jgi:hypothetical protein